MISTLCRVRQHRGCANQLNGGFLSHCDCICHKLTEQEKKPPTLDFHHDVKEHSDVKVLLNEIATIIASQMPPNMGFALMMFDYGEGGNFFYASSANRTDMIKMMKEFIEKRGKLG